MASEKQILGVLDTLTMAAPTPRLESLTAGARAGVRATARASARSHAESMRHIINSDNVVAVGISEKISKRKKTGKLALIFYVEKKIPRDELTADMFIPPTIPESLSGPAAIPTDVKVLGRIKPEVKARRNPIQPGFSIGLAGGDTGTIGAVVSKSDDFLLLSNSHVLAAAGLAQKGDSLIYPGAADGGAAPADIIATLVAFEKFTVGGDFVNRVDCALAKPTQARVADLISEIQGVGIPKGTIKPKRGMKVVKLGRTTGKTKGEVRDVNFRFTLDFANVGKVGFVDQVLCTRYTDKGDSGSLVIDQATGRAVGLHFAGASGGSVFTPIDVVLKTLGVKLVTKAIGKAASKSAKKGGKKSKSKKSAKKR
jgi:hypothetical protein